MEGPDERQAQRSIATTTGDVSESDGQDLVYDKTLSEVFAAGQQCVATVSAASRPMSRESVHQRARWTFDLSSGDRYMDEAQKIERVLVEAVRLALILH